MREWFKIKAAKAEDAVAHIDILDFIGTWGDEFWGDVVTAKTFVEALAKLPEAVTTIRIGVNSPGGDVFAAITIANALREQRASKGRRVEMVVEGLAASAASVVLMAGDSIEMADNALLMIHDPWSWAIGSADEMRKSAEALDKVRDTIITTYQWQSPLSAEEIGALMSAETWMDADEAVANGFATAKVEGLKAAAALDPRAATKLRVPEKYADRVQALLRVDDPAPEAPPAPSTEPVRDAPLAPVAPPPETDPAPAVADAAAELVAARAQSNRLARAAHRVTEVIRLCREAGLDLDYADALAKDLSVQGDDLTNEAINARVSQECERRATAEARADEIRALCARARQEDLAGEYVAGGMTVEQVRSQLTKITAKLDKVEIDAGLEPDHGTRKKAVIDVVAVYAERNRLKN